MPRPTRGLWVQRAYARRRHRTWIRSMVLAAFGWGVVWVHLLLMRFAPGLTPPPILTSALGIGFGVAGLGMAVLTVRAQKAWLLFVLVPLIANASLLLLPAVLWELLDR